MPPLSTRLALLPYRAPKLGRDYWVLDRALSQPDVVRQRLAERTDWALGSPYRPERWPGRRCADALTRDELAPLERWVRQQTRARSLWQADAPEGAHLDHNVLQEVGKRDGVVRPHTDSRRLCTYAAVLYLTPEPEPACGTTFFRLRGVGGRPGGNCVEAPHTNLVDALGTSALPVELWTPDVAVDNCYNRLLLYRANLVHAASGYFGDDARALRATAVFFWMAR